MEVLRIKNISSDLKLLHHFISNLGEAKLNFRYFDKREMSAIQNHLVTLLVMNDDIPVGYGHLDQENGNIWLGISVNPDFQGQGIGNILMTELISDAKENNIEKIHLTVDKENITAQKLYEKFKFKKIELSENITFYKYNLILNDE